MLWVFAKYFPPPFSSLLSPSSLPSFLPGFHLYFCFPSSRKFFPQQMLFGAIPGSISGLPHPFIWGALEYVDHNRLWKILKEMGIPDHLTCLLRNLHVGQEATVRTGHGTTDWFQIGKGACQGCILSPCLFNFYAEYIMRNAGLEEAQAGIKIAGRNINNLRSANDTTLMAESEEELKSLLMKVKEESEKVGLKLNI